MKLLPTVKNSGTAELFHRRSRIVAFLSEPAKGKPPAAVAAFASGSESKNSLLAALSLLRAGAFREAKWCFPEREIISGSAFGRKYFKKCFFELAYDTGLGV